MAKAKKEPEMTSELIDKLRHDAREALTKVFKAHGVVIQRDSVTYGPGVFGSLKFEVSVGNASRIEYDFKACAADLGLKPADLGRWFVSDGEGKEMRYKIIGCQPRSKMPLIVEREDGKERVFPVHYNFGSTVKWCDEERKAS